MNFLEKEGKIYMKDINLKEEYLKFFESKSHKIIPSAPVIPETIQHVYLILLECNHLFLI